MDINALNEKFSIEGSLAFSSGPGGLPFAKMTTPDGSAEICLHGAHLTSYQPADEDEVIWVSERAEWQEGKAIRGGVPVCWPWFADHSSDDSLPAHGIARTAMWDVVWSDSSADGSLQLLLSLPEESVQKKCFAPAFDLHLTVTLGKKLSIELTAMNRSDTAFEVTEALHTYLRVSDIAATFCDGLDGVAYLDKVDGLRQKMQQGDVIFTERTDRIYESTTSEIVVHDPSLERKIRVKKTGSDTTVVWNPGALLSAKMSDMSDIGYRTMVCVEAANAASDSYRLEPGERHSLSTTISVEPD